MLPLGCKKDRANPALPKDLRGNIEAAMAREVTGYQYGDAAIVDTVHTQSLARQEIAELNLEIARNNAIINQERLTIDIHGRSPDPSIYVQSDKSSRENMEFYKKLIDRSLQRIEKLRPLERRSEILGYVVHHRFGTLRDDDAVQQDRYVFVDSKLRVLLIHREDRHDIRIAVYAL